MFEDARLLAAVNEAGSQLVGRLSDRAPRLHLVIQVDRALRLDMDRAGVLQALQNFLQNAAEAYDADADGLYVEVTAPVQRAGSEVEIRIRDKGCGVCQDRLPELFIPFGGRRLDDPEQAR